MISVTSRFLSLLSHPGPSYGTSEHEKNNVRKLVDVLGEAKSRCCLIDRREIVSRYATGSAAAIPVIHDDEAVDQMVKEARRGFYNFLWTQLVNLLDFQIKR